MKLKFELKKKQRTREYQKYLDTYNNLRNEKTKWK